MAAGAATADAPLVHPPFYAVKVVPGSLGTFVGLRTDPDARVLDTQGVAIPGLYACGADMASIMGGRYPSGGITLGPAMTFGYIAANHMAASPGPTLKSSLATVPPRAAFRAARATRPDSQRDRAPR